MGDPRKHDITLYSYAKLISVLICVVTGAFLVPRLIDRHCTSISCIQLPYRHSLMSLVNFLTFFILVMFSHHFLDCVALFKGLSQVIFSVRV